MSIYLKSPLSSADFTICTPGIGPLSYTVSSPLGSIQPTNEWVHTTTSLIICNVGETVIFILQHIFSHNGNWNVGTGSTLQGVIIMRHGFLFWVLQHCNIFSSDSFWWYVEVFEVCECICSRIRWHNSRSLITLLKCTLMMQYRMKLTAKFSICIQLQTITASPYVWRLLFWTNGFQNETSSAGPTRKMYMTTMTHRVRVTTRIASLLLDEECCRRSWLDLCRAFTR